VNIERLMKPETSAAKPTKLALFALPLICRYISIRADRPNG
jgi:hypothetical protein